MYHEKFIRKHANRFLKNLNLEVPMALIFLFRRTVWKTTVNILV